MEKTTVPYQTLQVINGQEYITVDEHEKILKGVLDFQQAMSTVNDHLASLEDSVKSLKKIAGKN